jgi:hypothetical protein
MQDSKDTTLVSDRCVDGEQDATSRDHESRIEVRDNTESDGWQQYRKWISKAPAPRTRRSSIDPSLYTWKGYRNWSEQIRRNWSDS